MGCERRNVGCSKEEVTRLVWLQAAQEQQQQCRDGARAEGRSASWTFALRV